jgi:phosphoglucomutase
MSYIEEYKRWVASPFLSVEGRAELEAIAGDEKEIESRFYSPLQFGTAGLRGTMAVGLRNMNVYVIRQVTQAMAQLVIDEDSQDRGVAISYDCRHNSELFAREAARVLAANGIRVYLFDGMRPTPELSFAVRHYGCIAGINITASHNPREYNGYKAYWEDGAQLPPEYAASVEKAIAGIDIFTGPKLCDFDKAVRDGLIRLLGEETDEEFIKNVLIQSIDDAPVRRKSDKLRIVYTPFHGAGYRMVPEVLRRIGYKNILCVGEQMVPDGDFPTVANPNPEFFEGFELAIRLAKESDAGLIIGTDPDCDRVSIVIKDDDGEYVQLSGNQTGVLLLDYIIKARKAKGVMPRDPFTVKTIVTTEMARAVSESNGIGMFDTFTGFKFIAEKINEQEKLGKQCIFSYEESIGYLIGDHCRDKDAVTASMLLAEMYAFYAEKGMTLSEALRALYEEHGAFSEETINVIMPGLDGLEKMNKLMGGLRDGSLTLPGALKAESVRDYLAGTETWSDGRVTKIEPVGSDVVGFCFEGGSRLMVRPSGTEPKIKFYLLARGDTMEQAERMRSAMKEFVGSVSGQ